MNITYRGYIIRRIIHQGTVCYVIPALEGRDIALSLATAKRWIDYEIAAKQARK